VGPIVAQSLHNYFQNPKNLEILDKLKKGGVAFPEEEAEARETLLEGKTFVLTGGLDSMTRDEARGLIEERGGRVSSSVSKKTDFVVVGKDPGSKRDKARKLGVQTLSEDDFNKMIGR
jgi:DNA ligase (NAD+)